MFSSEDEVSEFEMMGDKCCPFGKARSFVTVQLDKVKIYTKAQSIKLAKAALNIIHKNQVGFIPGRSIID